MTERSGEQARSLAELGYYDLVDVKYQLDDASFTSIDNDSYRASLPLGRRAALTVTGVFEDGTELDLTDQVTWTVTPAEVARVEAGQLTALSEGTATLNTLIGEYLAKADLVIDVGPAALLELATSLSEIELPAGTSVRLNIAAIYSDGALPVDADWQLSSDNIAVTSTGEEGELLISAPHSATVGDSADLRLTLSDLPTVIVPVTVVGGQFSSLFLSPPVATVGPGGELTMQALASFQIAGETRLFDVTRQATWQTNSERLVETADKGSFQATDQGDMDSGLIWVDYSYAGEAYDAEAELIVSPITAQCGPSTPLVAVNDPCSVDNNNYYTDGWAGAWRFPQCGFYAALPNSQIRVLINNTGDQSYRITDVKAVVKVLGDDPATEEAEQEYTVDLNATDDFGGFDSVTIQRDTQLSLYVFLNDVKGYLTECTLELDGSDTLPAPLRDL